MSMDDGHQADADKLHPVSRQSVRIRYAKLFYRNVAVSAINSRLSF